MKLGVSYYPEISPESEWEADLRNMREAGLTVIRMTEFAWSAMEPREGVYDFGWLDRFLGLAHQHGFEVILCTPTATPPAWLGTQYPEIYVELAEGSRRSHGGRRDMDLDNEVYRWFCVQIASRLGERYGSHPAVIGWQIDNELFGVEGPDLRPGCHTRAATFRFRQYLKRVHGDLGTLNRRWGTRFWSQEYSSWGEIETPRHPRATLGQWLDFTRWFNESLSDFLRLQAQALREVVEPRQLITHNSTAIFDRAIDHVALADSMDVAGWDAYLGAAGNPHPEAFTALAHDLFRSAKTAPFWVLETGALPPNNGRAPAFFAEMRAHGAEMAILWHWRGHRSGAEHRHDTFCDHAGRPWADRMAIMQALAKRPELSVPLPKTFQRRKAAIFFSSDCVSEFLSPNPYAKRPRPFAYLRAVIESYHAFRRLGVDMDVVRPGDSLDGYQLLVMPAARLLDGTTAKRVSQFVTEGGTLLGVAKLAHADSWGSYYAVPGEPLAEVLGLTVRQDLDLPEGQEVRTEDGQTFISEAYGDRIEVTTARVVATCAGAPWDGQPAATINKHGRGRAYYCAVRAPGLIAHLGREAAQHAGLPLFDAPSGDAVAVPALEGRGHWILNYGDKEVSFNNTRVAPLDFAFINK